MVSPAFSLGQRCARGNYALQETTIRHLGVPNRSSPRWLHGKGKAVPRTGTAAVLTGRSSTLLAWLSLGSVESRYCAQAWGSSELGEDEAPLRAVALDPAGEILSCSSRHKKSCSVSTPAQTSSALPRPPSVSAPIAKAETAALGPPSSIAHQYSTRWQYA